VRNSSLNSNLGQARSSKKDEFYTQLTDIEKELKNYKKQFKGKVVYCNCDDPRISNFFHYFSYNFEKLGLKRLIATCYKNVNSDKFSEHESDKAIHLEYNGGKNGNGVPNPDEIGIKQLDGDGDFRSDEGLELLKQADIVVTNPPFSLFRDFISTLIEYDKDFLIIGDQNALTYKEVFSLVRDNKIWLGYDNGGTKWFQVPNDYDIKTKSRIKIVDGIKYFSKGSITWFTNLDTTKRHENLIMYKAYSPEEYEKYDNYDAININKVAEIPMDFTGVMGVPITFVNKYNPDQFEIIGLAAGNIKGMAGIETLNGKDGPYINGKLKYGRILVRNNKPQKS